MEVTNFEETLVKTYGLKGLKNQAVTNAVLYALRKMKTHLYLKKKILTIFMFVMNASKKRGTTCLMI